MKSINAAIDGSLRMVCRLALASLLAPGAQAAAPARVPTAAAQLPPDVARGQLLYSTHCVACHSAKMHWREKKLAVDRPALQKQVRRWMVLSGLNWGDDEADAVAQYLDVTYYHFAEPAAPLNP